ncbi:MAG: pseudouridylate synthase [Myxococcales bacterium]|nr:pseudouridylate synthase [Myxococcales bacterium]
MVHATRGAIGRPLLQRVRDHIGAHVWPIHRLDAATSGVLVFAKSPSVAGDLGQMLRRGEMVKHYFALVRGRPPPEGMIDNPVPRAEHSYRVPAQTCFRCQWHQGRYAWMWLRPITGRRHQLRRHLKHMSWPIIGDVRYGKGEHNRIFNREYGLVRMALHAARLRCPLPSGGVLEVSASVPEDLREPLLRWGLPPDQLEDRGWADLECIADEV